MKERVVVKRTPRGESGEFAHDFLFTPTMVPALANGWQGAEFLRQYRQRAWESLPKPKNAIDS